MSRVPFWVPNYLVARMKLHDWPAAVSGRSTCRRCRFVLTESTVYSVPPMCVIEGGVS